MKSYWIKTIIFSFVAVVLLSSCAGLGDYHFYICNKQYQIARMSSHKVVLCDRFGNFVTDPELEIYSYATDQTTIYLKLYQYEETTEKPTEKFASVEITTAACIYYDDFQDFIDSFPTTDLSSLQWVSPDDKGY